jgi:hypothetical protein
MEGQMNIKPLEKKIGEHFKINSCRVKFIAAFVSILFLVRTVNFTHIAKLMPGCSKISSKYRTIQRFFELYDFDLNLVAKFIHKNIPADKFYLTLDRTNWKFGCFNINVLVLGIAYDKISFPILWTMLDKKGNSNTLERIDIIKKYLFLFENKNVECLLCDREFIGHTWFNYLISNAKVNFRIRVKDCYLINKKNGKESQIKNFFRNIKPGEYKILPDKRILWGIPLYIVGGKNIDGTLIVIVTEKEPETAMQDYAIRWSIEVLFKCLKTNGFNFEDTHLKDKEKISKLLGLLAIAFCWAYLVGEYCAKIDPIKIKKHLRKAKSVFRLGADFLGNIIMYSCQKNKEFKYVVQLLSCT